MPVWLCPRRSLKCDRLRWLPALKIRIFHIRRDKEPAPGPSARNADGAQRQPPESEPSKQDGNKFSISLKIPSLFWKILAVVVVVGGSGTFAVLVFKRRRAQEEAALLERRRRRAERLKETGISEADFDLMMQREENFLPERERKAPAGKGRKRK